MKLEIEQEEYSDFADPRQWDNVGTMVCFGRYRLGDEQYKSEGQWLAGMLIELSLECDTEEWGEFMLDVEADVPISMKAAWAMIEKRVIALPLYLYDHGGLTMNTTGFSCRWDSGQAGHIYVTKEKACEEFGWKMLTAKRREKVVNILKEEVEEYDKWLTGDVWYVVVRDSDGDALDSCGGILGRERAEELGREMLEACREAGLEHDTFFYGLSRETLATVKGLLESEDKPANVPYIKSIARAMQAA